MMPLFRYYQAPLSSMAGLDTIERHCVFCGQTRRCFSLTSAYSFVPGMSEATRDGRFGCGWCLKAGHFGFTKATEFGSIFEEQVLLVDADPNDPEDFLRPFTDEARISIPEQALRELIHTPNFLDWNEVAWRTCCKDFMVYLGEWQPTQFIQEAGLEKAKDLFHSLIEEGYAKLLWEEDAPPESFGWISIHVFRCLNCQRLAAAEDHT